MRKPDPVAPTQVKRMASGGFSQDGDIPTVVTERRLGRKSQPRLPIDDDEESDGAQADEEPLAGSRVRTCLVNVDTSTTCRRSAVVSSASRRSLIEDDYDATLSNEANVLTQSFFLLFLFTLRVAAIFSFLLYTMQ